ncbi:MAG: HAD family hydrolase [Verrucomicrobia bacterium]|nr:HAD family hydrolase [Verrucomicrobiota bacterium]
MFLNLPLTGRIEVAPTCRKPARITHVLFDFDGTLSLIRQGWPEVMVPMFMEMLPRRAGENEEAVRQMLFDDIMKLNGKQTIYQMMQFAERVKERGGSPLEPLEYKHEYLRRLDFRIRDRIKSLRGGRASPDDFLVHRSRALLDDLARRGLTLYLASGTDEQYVKQEAEILQVSRYFQGRIHGAKDDYKSFSKKMIIDKIIADHAIPGEQLLSFGDGYVEIQNTKEAGGFAVAVASDEANNGSGNMDEWKRRRLMGVGADLAIPDYRDMVVLLKALLD